jgi:hypothetical protein
MAAKKKAPAQKSKPTTDLSFTAGELEMLRDIFGVVMPVLITADAEKSSEMGEACVAEYVAAVTNRVKLEHTLWKKIAKACTILGVVTGAAAPTFAVSAAHVPAMHVYKLED